MRIVISGASGLLGSALAPALRADGHSVVRLVRREARSGDEVSWDPAAGLLDPSALDDADAVVNLSGAGIGDRRWTAKYKRTLVDSRLDTTRTLSSALARAEPRPRVMLSGSGVNWYGDTGSTPVDETAPHRPGFLADLVRDWEGATAEAEAAGVRVVHLRTAPVYAREGGLLAPIRLLFSAGLGGRLGNGRQYMPWISLEDHVRAMRFLLGADDVRGPVNMVAPEQVTNAEFTRTLARVLHRPAVLPVPAFAMRLALDGLADEGALISLRVVPGVLLARGFRFRHPDLETALRWATSR